MLLTFVIFDQKSSKNTVFSDDFWSKMTIVSSLKPIKINRTPPFYLRGYGNPEALVDPAILKMLKEQKITKMKLTYWYEESFLVRNSTITYLK